MIKPEQLKAVAEYMGYEVRESDNPKLTDRVVIWNGKDIHTREIYNPLQNSDQCLELMEKFKICVMPAEENIFWDAYLGHDGKIYEAVGKTINEAVTLAAIAYVDSVKESDDE